MRRLGRGLATLTLALIPHIASSALPEATTYQITVDHAGVTASGGVLALQETPLWSAPLSGTSSYPIIAGGRVFVTTAGLPGSANNYGTELYAFDAQTGATLWGPRPGQRVAQFAVCTSDRESHHEDCAYLLERK